MIRNRFVIPAIFIVFPLALQGAPSVAYAGTVSASVTAVLSDPEPETPEVKFIKELGEKATSILGDSNLSAAQLDAGFYTLFNSAFDIERVGQFAVGSTWAGLSVAQRQEYLNLFKDFVLRNYGTRLRVYHGEKFQVKKVRSQGELASVVSTEIVRAYGFPPTYIDWVVRNNNGKLSIVDVVIDGISQSVTQRDQLASILSRNGGDFNALLEALRERMTQTAATTGSIGSELPVSP